MEAKYLSPLAWALGPDLGGHRSLTQMGSKGTP